MKNLSIASILLFLCCFNAAAQSGSQTGIAADSVSREYSLGPLQIEGEVDNPGMLNLDSLPVHTVSVKEVSIDESGHHHFEGAFFYTGVSLYDILSTRTLKKENEMKFKPAIDMYVTVENARGDQTVFSWGEISFARNNSTILISKSVKSINPSKMKTRWALPTVSRLICANDLSDVRFIDSPTKITVKSFVGEFGSMKSKNIFSPTIEFLKGSQKETLGEIPSTVEKRTYTYVGYGHGMGYKGVQSVRGYVLKDILSGVITFTPGDLRNSLAVVSAKDGYRSVFSLSELVNRSDNLDVLLVDRKDSQKDGRYSLFVTPDFFVDRNVKAVERIEIKKIQ